MPNEIIKLTPRYKIAHDIYISLLKLGFDEKTIQDFLNNINDADVVEVVRCKDCKHSKKAVGNNGIIICVIDSEVDEETGIDYGFVTYYSENHFCGYGERRSE